MPQSIAKKPVKTAPGVSLRVYLLPPQDFGAVQFLQRALVYQVQEERLNGELVLCEHAPLITVGRQAGPGNIDFDPQGLRVRGWPVRWVNRGGGCWLHLPGQLAVYCVLALDRMELAVRDYVERLQHVVVALLDDFRIQANVRPGHPGIWVGQRTIGEVGVAVRDWVAYYGFVLNLHPDLVPYRSIRSGGPEDGPMTSIERERRGPFRPALARELLLEHFGAAFPFERTSLFFNHALLEKTIGAARVGVPS